MYEDFCKVMESFKEEITKSMSELEKKMETLLAKVEKVDVLEEKVEMLEKKIETMERELRGSLNDREQYARSWSVRISGLEVIRAEEEKLGRDRAVMKKTYGKIFKPILQVAKDNGDIESIPSYYNLLENGHKLLVSKGSKGSFVPPLIVRFSSRYMRNTVLRNKRHMPRPTDAEVAAGVKKYFVFEDLTKTTYVNMKKMMGDDRVEKVWTIDGKLHYILRHDITKKVQVVKYSENFENIFKQIN